MEDKSKNKIHNSKLKNIRLSYYLKIWLMMSRNSFMNYLNQKNVLFIFLLGKMIRFVFFMAFLFFLIAGAGTLAGYSSNQAIFFFLTFTLVDTLSQFLFREVYRFRTLVVSGDFDLVLVKPVSALFRVLMGGADVIDLITIPPIIAVIFYVGGFLSPTGFEIIIYFLLLISALVISMSFHIMVISMGIMTMEIDNSVMIYRDLSSMARFPVDIYKGPLGTILTYVIPLALMMTFPAKGLMGLLDIRLIFLSFGVSAMLAFLSFRFWNFALKRYTSASS